MSCHNEELYPLRNTPELRAEMALHGLDPYCPSQMSDSFRHGWVAALKARSHAKLLEDLKRIIELDLSSRADCEKALKVLLEQGS